MLDNSSGTGNSSMTSVAACEMTDIITEVCDMVKRTLWTRAIKLVLDKPDEMLTRGFKDQIYDVYRYLPPELQVVLISATLPNEILNLMCNFTDPIRILAKRDELTLERLRKIFAVAEMEESKSDNTLCELYDTRSIIQAVIFCSTKQKRHASEGARCHNGKVQANKCWSA